MFDNKYFHIFNASFACLWIKTFFYTRIVKFSNYMYESSNDFHLLSRK